MWCRGQIVVYLFVHGVPSGAYLLGIIYKMRYQCEKSIYERFFTRKFVPAAQNLQVERKAWLL
jgi:hypothetical protein